MNNTTSQDIAAVHVLVVDDQRLMRDGLASLLSVQKGIEIVGTAANGQEAVELALALHPEVILMDVRMPVMDGVQATLQICSLLPSCKVLMLTTFDDDEYISDALQAGANGYLLKDIPAHDLANAILAVHSGIYQLDPTIANKIVAALSPPTRQTATIVPPAPSRISTLTERELEVLRLITHGAANREIAEQLVLSEGTVKNHISNILSRLGLRDRTQAAIYARDNGLL